jgi:hypothetical protein
MNSVKKNLFDLYDLRNNAKKNTPTTKKNTLLKTYY